MAASVLGARPGPMCLGDGPACRTGHPRRGGPLGSSGVSRTTQLLHVAGLEGTELKLVTTPSRLVVFVHGFGGEPVASWAHFALGSGSPWWDAADLLFVGYDSTRLDVLGVASALRFLIQRTFPHLAGEYLYAGGAYLRPPDAPAYSELIVVGHSLGGVVVRRAIVDMVNAATHDGTVETDPALSQGRLCLFSPATAGFDPTGDFGLFVELIGQKLLRMSLRSPPALRALRPGSAELASCQRTTEVAQRDHEAIRLLQPQTVWANPDHIVVALNYDTDLPSYPAFERNHRNVCKPNFAYPLPWSVVETGALP